MSTEGLIEISVVIPVFQEEKTLEELLKRLETVLRSFDFPFEIILIDDGSIDNSWKLINKLAPDFPELTGLKLSRNFGQHNAIFAGLHQAVGQWVVVMDGDLQDKPEEIVKLYNTCQEGYDVVIGERVNRQDSGFKKLSSKFFYRFFKILSGLKFEKNIVNFGISSKNVILTILDYRENFRPFPIIVRTVGFKRISIPVVHQKRVAGTSNYNPYSLLKGAVNVILYYSNRPICFF